MTDDEKAIRSLIERWATAVHACDLDWVLADHADDIVMFDVPPPDQGGAASMRTGSTWPPFFEWQAKGASFEIESLEVTAGNDVACRIQLAPCGTPDELTADPDLRLRLTIGLRKHDGRWLVTHEHHSFPAKD